MGSRSTGRYCRRKKVGFWQSFPARIIVALLAIIIAIAFVAIGVQKSSTSQKQQKNREMQSATENIDLYELVGRSVSECEQALNVDFHDAGNNTYYVEYSEIFSDPIELFRCTFDENGELIKIHLKSSGKLGYTLLGISSSMDEDAAIPLLQEAKMTYLYEGIWLCANEKDIMRKESEGWSYEKAPENLQDMILYAKTVHTFSYQHEDSEGAYYLGHGQMLEYYSSSFAKFMYQYSQLTEYQRSLRGSEAEGRYVYLWGKVTSVSDDGTILVFCDDENAMEEFGSSWPITASAGLHIVSEQEPEIFNLSKGDEVTAFGKISSNTYTNLIISGYAELTDAIILSVNSQQLEIPVFQRAMPEITIYGRVESQENTQESTGSQATSSPTVLDSYTTDQLITAYIDNKFKAESTFMDAYINLTGKIRSFSDFSYSFNLEEIYESEYHSPIECEFDPNLHLSHVAELQIGDVITIKCKVTQVGDLGSTYTVQVLDFLNSSDLGVYQENKTYEMDPFIISLPNDWEDKYVLEHNYSARSEFLAFYYKSQYEYYEGTYSEPGGWPFAIEIRADGDACIGIAGWEYIGTITDTYGYQSEIYLHYPIDPQFMDGSYDSFLEDARSIAASISEKDGYTVTLAF